MYLSFPENKQTNSDIKKLSKSGEELKLQNEKVSLHTC